MTDFAPYAMRAELALPAEWAAWVSAVVAGQQPAAPVAPPFSRVEASLARHGVLPVLYDRLRADASWHALAPEIRAALASAFQTSAARTFLLDGELARIAAAAPGLTLLKGSALGRTVYNNPALRPVSDLDLLVERERAGEVQRRLEGIGYRGLGLTAHPRVGRLARRYRCELPLVGPVAGLGSLLVELHWSLAELPYYVDLIPAAALQAGASRLPELPDFAVPRPAVSLAVAAGHLALHHSRDLRLIWLVDFDCLARSGRVDWDDLLGLAERWKLGLALHAGLKVVRDWLGTPVEPSVLAELARLAGDPIAVRAWGLGDAAPGRARRRAAASFRMLPAAAAIRYAGWLALRSALRPLERAGARREGLE
jgi:hypothetical protein